MHTSKYVLMASNNYGRYSNMRTAFVMTAAFAMYTNRSLLYTLPTNCNPQVTWDELLDTRHLPLTAHAAELEDMLRCKRHGFGHMLVNHAPENCHSKFAIPLPDPDRYLHSFLHWMPVSPVNKTKWTMEKAAEKIAPSTCAGVLCPWEMFNVDWPLYHTMNRLDGLMRPSAAIEEVVQMFARQYDLVKPFVGIHLRLTDIGGTGGNSCKMNITEIIIQAEHLLTEVNSRTVLLATDDIESACAKSIISNFAPVHVVSNVWDPSSCQEAVFVQEVLAKSSAFIGHGQSTFSIATESIRRHRYGAHINGTLVVNA